MRSTSQQVEELRGLKKQRAMSPEDRLRKKA